MNTPPLQEIFDATVLQDKGAPERASSPHFEAINESPPPRKHHGSEKRRGMKVDGYLLKSEVAVVDRLKEKRTRRSEVSELIRIGLAVKLGKQQVDVILPPLVATIQTELKGFSNRFMKVVAEAYYAAKQGELLEEEVIATIHKDDPNRTHDIVTQTRNKARGSL